MNHFDDDRVRETYSAAVKAAGLALEFGRIDRTGVCHPGGAPESDTDHTVMLAWLAPAFADLVNDQHGYEYLNVGKVCQFAVVHDMPEVFAGDTPTLRITPEQQAEKEHREWMGAVRLAAMFRGMLPWIATWVRTYEQQACREARFVRAVDKILPKLVHLIGGGVGLRRERVTRDQFDAMVTRQRAQLMQWLDAGSLLVLKIYDEAARVAREEIAFWTEDDATSPAPRPQPSHSLRVTGSTVSMQHHNCLHPEDGETCPFTLAYHMATRSSALHLAMLPQGDHPVELDGRGGIVFNGKED